MVIEIIKEIAKLKISLLFFISGIVLLIISQFDLQYQNDSFVINRVLDINFLLWVSTFLIIISISLLLFENNIITLSNNKISETEKGFSILINNKNINIIYGQIENCSTSSDSVVILPTNEFFDKECIEDVRSALGCYIKNKFPQQLQEFKNLIESKLQSLPYEVVQKEIGVTGNSYGIGTSIFLEKPLSSNYRLILTATTTKRAGQGLQARISYIFNVIEEIHKIIVDKRLDTLYMPIIGQGHGQLKCEVALFGIMLALLEVLRQSNIREINIIIYKPNNLKEEPNRKIVKQILETALNMFNS